MRSVALLVVAAAVVGVVHSILPDHWVPLAVVGRTQRWSLFRVARISLLAAGGHVLASLVLAGVIALIGLRFEKAIATQQGHIVGGVLVLTGVGFLLWGLTGHGHAHGHDHGDAHDRHDQDEHDHDEHDHEEHGHESEPEVVALLKSRMNAWIARREAETGLTNPIHTQGDWHGHEGVGPFTSSQQAYDTMHIGGPGQAAKLQASPRA